MHILIAIDAIWNFENEQKKVCEFFIFHILLPLLLNPRLVLSVGST